jgi:hypothetical protein
MIHAVVLADSAIKRPKDKCACANFAHTVVSVRDDFGIWLARPACVQRLHIEHIVLGDQSILDKNPSPLFAERLIKQSGFFLH